jgi:glycosyltransferase involved in cell wall biosynthesis
MRVSVIVPVFNERETVATIVDRVMTSGIDVAELLIVDDGSTDGTGAVLDTIDARPKCRVLRHNQNRGKGAAIATALKHATGNVIVIQDADLEYDPSDLPELVEPILAGRADVVFGSRFLGGKARRVAYHRQRWANWLLTWLSNQFTRLDLTDMECGYKAFRRELVAEVEVRERGFGFEPEITAKLARQRPRAYEVPVTYHARTFAQGKKIGLRDGLRAVYAIVRYGWLD